MNKHWTTDYIGKSWEAMGRGPSSFDCWGLVWYVYQSNLGITLPLFLIDPNDTISVSKQITETKQKWVETTKPIEHSVVILGRIDSFHHVGIWTCSDRGLVVHACDNSFVVAQSIATLKRTGWHKMAFYNYQRQ